MDRENPLIDPNANVHRLGLEGWGSAFSTEREPGKLYFEGTTHLIYQETALSVLPGLSTQPKFIFVLRDPIERVASSFNYTQGNLAQVRHGLTIDRYFEMVAGGDVRELRRFVLSDQSAYVLERDLRYSNYWLYLQRWLEAVGRDRMLVLQFEQLIDRPLDAMREVCSFLGVSPSCFEAGYDFPARNVTLQVASTKVHRWAQRVARVVPPGRVKRALSRTYYWAQQRDSQRAAPRPSPRVCELLRRELEPSAHRLGEMFDIDLQLWRSTSRSALPSEKPPSPALAGQLRLPSGPESHALKGRRA